MANTYTTHKTQTRAATFERKRRNRRTRPVGGTKQEWTQWFCDQLECVIEVQENELVAFEPEYGFVSFVPDFQKKMFLCHYVAGDVRHWLDFARKYCKQHGLNSIRFYTRHDPCSMERLTGAHIRGYLMELEV